MVEDIDVERALRAKEAAGKENFKKLPTTKKRAAEIKIKKSTYENTCR